MRTFASVVFAAALSANAAIADVGYFNPGGVRTAFVNDVDMVSINAVDGEPERAAESLRLASEAGAKVNLDIGVILTTSRPASDIVSSYDGREKQFDPRVDNKLRDFVPDDVIRQRLAPQIEAIKSYKDALNAVFLVDEPYLNGVSKQELERVGALVRNVFAEHGVPGIRLGVLYAGAMFNSGFAQVLQYGSLNYVKEIDGYLLAEKERINDLPLDEREDPTFLLRDWIRIISDHRLTTYDSAGNLYTGGGIPEGFDIVAFDFYLSTLLLDRVYEDTLSWLAHNTETPECDGFEGAEVSDIRKRLSFFQEGSMLAGDDLRPSDDQILDRLYRCRMGATIELLQRQLAEQAMDAEIMVVTEASPNGLLEFDSSGQPELEQPTTLVDKRVADEVRRALEFLPQRADHILFFTFDDAFDRSINLEVGGVSSNPEAVEAIRTAAATNPDG